MSAPTWHYVENQFDNATKESRKRMNIILTDHLAKLAARVGEHATISTLHGATVTVVNTWTSRYTAWRNALAAYHSATRTFENLLTTLKVAPVGSGRSKIDEWETRTLALWPASDEMYVFFFPQGRAPFTGGGYDNVIDEVKNLGLRFATKISPLTAARDALQAQVDAIIGGGGTPSAELQEQLDEAKDRVDTVTSLSGRVTAFYNQMKAARDDQQGKEGLADGAATLVGEQRVVAARRMFANLGRLMDYFVLLPGENPEPQVAAADFYDLDTLMQTGEDEEPVEDPPAPPPGP